MNKIQCPNLLIVNRGLWLNTTPCVALDKIPWSQICKDDEEFLYVNHSPFFFLKTIALVIFQFVVRESNMLSLRKLNDAFIADRLNA